MCWSNYGVEKSLNCFEKWTIVHQWSGLLLILDVLIAFLQRLRYRCIDDRRKKLFILIQLKSIFRFQLHLILILRNLKNLSANQTSTTRANDPRELCITWRFQQGFSLNVYFGARFRHDDHASLLNHERIETWSIKLSKRINYKVIMSAMTCIMWSHQTNKNHNYGTIQNYAKIWD